MLKTVKSLVDRTPEMSFGEFYRRYIMEVQDEAIDREVKSMYHYSNMDMNTMVLTINEICKAVNKNDSSCDITKWL